MSRKYKKRKNGTTFRNLQWEQGLDYWMARNGYGMRTWGQYPSVDWSDKWKPEAVAFYKKNTGQDPHTEALGALDKAMAHIAAARRAQGPYSKNRALMAAKHALAAARWASVQAHRAHYMLSSDRKNIRDKIKRASWALKEEMGAEQQWGTPGKRNPKRRKLLVKRKAYRTKKGRRVPAKSFRITDRGRPGRGPYTLPKIKKGGLGGPGYTSKPESARRAILRKVVKSKGYRTALGRIMLLRRYGKRTMSKGVLKLLARDRKWLVKTFGGEGSFKKRKSRRRNPTHTAFVPHHGPGKIIARRPKNMVDVKLKNGRTVRVSARSLRRSR